MWQYNHMPNDNDWLTHYGTKGMRWGYTDGERNGGRVAGEEEDQAITRVGADGVEETVIIDEDYEGLFDTKSVHERYLTTGINESGSAKRTREITIGKGKITKAIEAGQRFVSSAANTVVSGAKSAINAGKNFVDNLFKRK